MTIQQIAIIGAGTTGSGIAQVCATAGYDTVMIDISVEALNQARDAIAHSVERLFAKGQISAEARGFALQVRTTTTLDAAAHVDCAIEAGPENIRIKQDIFKALDEVTQPGAILCTSTSSSTVTALAAQTSRPENVIGMHFMTPVPLLQLVEVIPGLNTSDATRDAILALAERLGKTAVIAGDFPGFISNRILYPMLNEAFFALMENVGTVEAIDTVFRLGMNHPMGPLMLADFIGLDVVLAVMDALWESYHDPKYRACPLLRKLVIAGHLGRKSGRGFYAYDDTGRPTGPDYP